MCRRCPVKSSHAPPWSRRGNGVKASSCPIITTSRTRQAAQKMSRSVRLFDLLQALRRHRRAVSANTLAEELGVSKRTIYRDIDALIALGAPIDGEAGIGYLMRP